MQSGSACARVQEHVQACEALASGAQGGVLRSSGGREGRGPHHGQLCAPAACVSRRRSPMSPVTSLLTALERHDIAALTDVLDHDGISDAHFTDEDAAVLWDAGWHAWLGGGRES